MNTVEKYNCIIMHLKEGFGLFASHLNIEQCSDLPTDAMFDTYNLSANSWDLTAVDWKDGAFPNSGEAGVYFLLTSAKEDSLSLAVYVGKASFNSFIGSRLYSHLYNPEKENRKYPVHDRYGNEYNVELIISIPFKEGLEFLAPACEEFMIKHLQSKNVSLLNSVGKL